MFHGCQFLIAVPSPVFARKQIIFDDIFNKSKAVIGSFDSSIRNPSKTWQCSTFRGSNLHPPKRARIARCSHRATLQASQLVAATFHRYSRSRLYFRRALTEPHVLSLWGVSEVRHHVDSENVRHLPHPVHPQNARIMQTSTDPGPNPNNPNSNLTRNHDRQLTLLI